MTSLASGMLRMILPGFPTSAAFALVGVVVRDPRQTQPFASAGVTWRGLRWFEGHTVCDRPRPVNGDDPSRVTEQSNRLQVPVYYQTVKRLPTDLEILEDIYQRYYAVFSSFSREDPKRSTKVFVPIDIETIASPHFSSKK